MLLLMKKGHKKVMITGKIDLKLKVQGEVLQDMEIQAIRMMMQSLWPVRECLEPQKLTAKIKKDQEVNMVDREVRRTMMQ